MGKKVDCITIADCTKYTCNIHTNLDKPTVIIIIDIIIFVPLPVMESLILLNLVL